MVSRTVKLNSLEHRPVIRVVVSRVFTLRIRIGILLIRLAGWVMCTDVKASLDGKP